MTQTLGPRSDTRVGRTATADLPQTEPVGTVAPVPGRTRRGSVRGRRVAAPPARRLSAAEVAQRVPFVVVVLLLIGSGVGGTLWLSARSTEETYALQNARDTNVRLAEQRSSLESSIERSRSAEELAARARALGMVGVDSAPIVVIGPDGRTSIVGDAEPKLGAPIAPLQEAQVPSVAGTPQVPGVFSPPPAQPAQDPSPRGVAPVPYPAPPAAATVAPAAPDAAVGEQAAPEAPAGAPTLAPVPGQVH